MESAKSRVAGGRSPRRYPRGAARHPHRLCPRRFTAVVGDAAGRGRGVPCPTSTVQTLGEVRTPATSLYKFLLLRAARECLPRSAGGSGVHGYCVAPVAHRAPPAACPGNRGPGTLSSLPARSRTRQGTRCVRDSMRRAGSAMPVPLRGAWIGSVDPRLMCPAVLPWRGRSSQRQTFEVARK